jgi:D-3-phosphoglycerate dehydrogenase / 2-oxoglutarate reductase
VAKVVLADHTKPIDEERLKLRLIREATGAETAEVPNGDQAALAAAMADADAVLVHRARIDDELLSTSPRLGLIVKCGIGVDTIDVDAATARGILVVNNPERGPEVAEHAMALILALARRVALADRRAREQPFPPTYDFTYLGSRMAGKTIGLIGFGKIARDLVPIAQGFGLAVVAYSRSLTGESAQAAGVTYAPLDDLLATSDIVSLHCPVGPQTRHLMNHHTLARMKSSALLINTARGEVVDERAVADALAAGALGGFGSDVSESEPLTPDNPLLAFPNVVMTPHMAWSSLESLQDGETVPARQVIQYLRGKSPDHPVNRPTEPRLVSGTTGGGR